MLIIKSKIFAAFFFVLSILLANNLAAEDLTLTQAIEIALKNNSSIKAAELSANAFKYAELGAGKLVNPEINISPNIIGDGGSDSAILITQPLEINGKRRIRKQLAVYESDISKNKSLIIKQDIMLKVTQLYWDIKQLQEIVNLNLENAAFLKSLGVNVQKQFDAGTIPESQVTKTEVEASIANQDLILAELELVNSKSSLNVLLNRPIDTKFDVIDTSQLNIVIPPKDQMISNALNTRPESIIAQLQVHYSKTNINAVNLQKSPDIAIQSRQDSFKSDMSRGVSVSVLFPIIDWGSVRNGRNKAELDYKSSEKELETVKSKIILDIEHAIEEVSAASAIKNVYQEEVLSKSEELLQIATTGYEKGATSYLEVLEAQRTLRNIRTSYHFALTKHAKAIALLQWASNTYELKTQAKS